MKINEFTADSKIFSEIGKNDLSKKDNIKNKGFTTVFKEKLDEVNEKQINAEKITSDFIKGDDVDIHEVMLSSEEAKMSMELAVQVRNKIIEAYQEFNRMQL